MFIVAPSREMSAAWRTRQMGNLTCLTSRPRTMPIKSIESIAWRSCCWRVDSTVHGALRAEFGIVGSGADALFERLVDNRTNHS